jgi:hypothetical protein
MLFMNVQLEKFNEERDKAIAGLISCDVILMRDEILQSGYSPVSYSSAMKGTDELELDVYRQGDKRLVYLETYTEREGGMYFQSMFADEKTVMDLEKKLVEESVRHPSTYLAETILHFRDIKIPGHDELFPDNSIYKGCHHFLTISGDPSLADPAISNYKKMDIGSEEKSDRSLLERRNLIIQAL